MNGGPVNLGEPNIALNPHLHGQGFCFAASTAAAEAEAAEVHALGK